MTVSGGVLAIDDDPMSLAVLEEVLDGRFELTTAPCGVAGVASAETTRPDVVLLDVVLPDIDGFEVCRRLRSIGGLAHTKILLVSACSAVGERLRGYDAGADDYVTKPFDAEELLAKIRVYQRLKTIEELDRLKGDLIDLLAHETRTPMSGVLPAAELLDSPGDMSEADRRHLARIVLEGGRRLAILNEATLALSQARCGRLDLKPVDLDLAQVVGAAVARIHAVSEEGSRLRVEIVGPTWVRADATRLRLVVDALLDVALRASDTCPCVQVAPAGEFGRLLVQMPDRRVPHVDAAVQFAAIERGGQVVGADLGLWLSHVVVTAQHGTVRTVSLGDAYAVEVCLPTALPGA